MSKQLDSILQRMPTATPALSVVQPTVTQPEPAPAIEARAETKPTLERPKKPASTIAAPKSKAPPRAEAAPAQQEAERSIQAYVPVSIAKALNMRAAAEDVTVRTLILQGLQAIGFEVPDELVRDRRK